MYKSRNRFVQGSWRSHPLSVQRQQNKQKAQARREGKTSTGDTLMHWSPSDRAISQVPLSPEEKQREREQRKRAKAAAERVVVERKRKPRTIKLES
jgi:hypothetical protein